MRARNDHDVRKDMDSNVGVRKNKIRKDMSGRTMSTRTTSERMEE